MNKPDLLRAAWTAALPDLRHAADRLQLYIDKGTVRSLGGSGLGFEYAYTLRALFLDFAGHPDAIMAPLLHWLRTHQPDLLQNHDRVADGIGFEVDLLDGGKADVDLSIPLTERVLCQARPGGGFDLSHPPEPVLAGLDAYPAGPPGPDTGPINLYLEGILIGTLGGE